MILTTHALVGAAIGKNLGNPWLIIPTSIAVHYALDIIPHGEYLSQSSTIKNTWWKVALDILVGFSAVFLCVYLGKSGGAGIINIALGALFSLFPDLLTLLYWKTNIGLLKRFYIFHNWLHQLISQEDMSWNFRNARNDILISFLAVLFLLV